MMINMSAKFDEAHNRLVLSCSQGQCVMHTCIDRNTAALLYPLRNALHL